MEPGTDAKNKYLGYQRVDGCTTYRLPGFSWCLGIGTLRSRGRSVVWRNPAAWWQRAVGTFKRVCALLRFPSDLPVGRTNAAGKGTIVRHQARAI